MVTIIGTKLIWDMCSTCYSSDIPSSIAMPFCPFAVLALSSEMKGIWNSSDFINYNKVKPKSGMPTWRSQEVPSLASLPASISDYTSALQYCISEFRLGYSTSPSSIRMMGSVRAFNESSFDASRFRNNVSLARRYRYASSLGCFTRL